MVGFKWNGRNQETRPQQRLGNRQWRQCHPGVENLEGRALLSGLSGPPTGHSTSTNVRAITNGPMANAGTTLIAIYAQYQSYLQEHGGSGVGFTSSFSNLVTFEGTMVGIDVRGRGNFATLEASLRKAGMQITGGFAPTDTISGFLPINALPAVSQMTQTVGIDPMFIPNLHSRGFGPTGGSHMIAR
jgi:hypothetical protein